MKSKIIKSALIAIALIAIIGYAGYITYQNRKNESLLTELKNKPTTVEPENTQIISTVSKLIELPDEIPTIGTVSDVEKLKNQQFFAKSQNGDKVLVYTKSQKAILFRPSTGKIIDVVPIVDSANASSSAKVAGAKTSVTPTPTPTAQPVSILLLNGTDTTGLATKIEPNVKDIVPEAKIQRETAQKQDYVKSTIIVLNQNGKTAAEKLSTQLSIPIGETPYGEDLVNRADVAIIIGADKK